MPFSRREFLTRVAGGMATGVLRSTPRSQAATAPPFKAIACDAFPIVDPRPVVGLAETLFPGKGTAFSSAWRTRPFEYPWLRALSGPYADFWRTTEDALVCAAKLLRLELTPDKRARLMQAYLGLKAWPEVPSALGTLREAGIRLAFLSNRTTKLLEAGIKHAGLDGVAAPRAYQMAMGSFQLRREDVLFAGFAGWDAAGAKWFGYPTFGVNRRNLPAEEWGVAPEATGRDVTDLVSCIKAPR